MKNMTASEADVVKQAIVAWRYDPVAFVKAAFGAHPDKWQEDALRSVAQNKRIAMSACKGPGKSCLMAWITLWFLFTRPHCNIVCVSITSDNLRDGLWKEIAYWMSKWPPLNQMFEFAAERIKCREFPNTWWVSARSFPRSADENTQNATLAGLHAESLMIVLDEIGDYPDGVLAAAEPIFANPTGEKRLVVAGNPLRTDGPLFRIVNNPKGWDVIKITGDPDDPKRSPRIDIEWARAEIEKWGRDHPWVMSNILGEFPPASSDQLIGQTWVNNAVARTLPIHHQFTEAIVWGLDVARFGDDETCLVSRTGNFVDRPIVWRHQDGTKIGDLVSRQIREAEDEGKAPDCVFVDVGGIGASVFDRLTALGWEDTIQPVDFGSSPTDSRFLNKRAEMWSEMAQWVKKSDSVLPKDNTMVAELCAPKFFFKANQRQTKMGLESKDDMKRRGVGSPNRADALALTFAEYVNKKSLHNLDVDNHSQDGVKARTDYNPLEA